MDLHTNFRGFAHKPSWICTQIGLEGPGFRFFNGVGGPRRARVQVFQRFCVQIHEGLCANPRRFVCKSTKALNLYNVQAFVDLHTNLRGFAHKPSWICTQTFVDLHTNLRGFAHKPAWRGQGSGFSLASRRARVQVFHRFSMSSTD